MASSISRHRTGRPELIAVAGRADRGPLGLHGEHREVADLIRRSERLAADGDREGLGLTAGRIAKLLARHISEEAAAFKNLQPARYEQVVAGQQALIDSAIRFADRPAADAGADLLALLVRQADIEEASFQGRSGATARSPLAAYQPAFVTDWAIPPPMVAG